MPKSTLLRLGFFCRLTAVAAIIAVQAEQGHAADLVKAEQPQVCAKGCVAEVKNPQDWDLSTAVGLNATQGNATSNVISVNAVAQKEIIGNLFRFEILGASGEQEKVKTQQFIKADAAYKYLLTDRTYLGFGGQALFDKIADVDYRYTVNPALGYFFLKDEIFTLNAEAGPSYIFEKLGGVANDYPAPRVAERFEWQISATSKVFQAVEYFLNAEDTNQYLINGEAGIEAAIATNLALVFSVRNRFNNQPAEGVDKNDVFYASSLKVHL